jgi:glycosyltransferase involved in cell wall biosynthesis
MKYLLTAGIYPPDIGGPASYLPEFATYLSESGDAVEIVTLCSSRSNTVYENFGKVTKVNRNINKFLRFILTSWKIFRGTSDSQVVFANGLYEEVAISSLFRRKQIIFKIVGDPIWERCRNSGEVMDNFDTYEISQLSTRLKLERLLFKWSLSRANVITCPGEKLSEIMKKNYGVENILVIENGIKPVSNECSEDFEYDIISVSRLVKWKRIDLLIRASVRTKTKLLVIGLGPEEQNLKNLSHDLDANVQFLGVQSRSEVLRYLRQSKIYALISTYEGLSFSLLEALSVGKRILVSNIEANQVLFRGTAIAEIVDPEDADQIDSAIGKLLDNTTENRARENAGKNLVNLRFNSEIQMQKMKNLMTSSINRS